MKNIYSDIKEEHKRKKKKIKLEYRGAGAGVVGRSLALGGSVIASLAPIGLGVYCSTLIIKGITTKAYESTISSEFEKPEKPEVKFVDKEEIEGKKSVISEYSSIMEMPDGTYMRTIKKYDSSTRDAEEVAKILKENPNADIKELFGEPIETTSEIIENIYDVDNVHKHYKATIYSKQSGTEIAFDIFGLAIMDIVAALFSIGIFACSDPGDQLDDLNIDILELQEKLSDLKKEKNKYKAQKLELKHEIEDAVKAYKTEVKKYKKSLK